MRISTRLVAGSAAAVTVLGMSLGASGVASATSSQRALLSGSKPTWAKSSTLVHAASGSTHVGFRVYLGWRSGAAALARSVSTPGSASYHHYLTPAQFRARFAPTAANTQAVQKWLRSQGFTVGYTPANRHYVTATGTLAQASKAFRTSFNVYRVAGKTLRAPSTTLSIPASLRSTVASVVGLDQSAALVRGYATQKAPPSAGFRNARPCSAYWAEKIDTAQPGNFPYAPCGYAGAQLQGAYGVASAIASGNDGSGVTVAVIDAYASPTVTQDLQTYSSRHGLPAISSANFTQIVPPGIYNVNDNNAQSPSGWYGEETLDVEAVHTMAPGAHIVYVGAPNNYQDLDASLNHVVDQHLADIVTNSYGWSTELLPPGYIKPYNDTMIQGAAEGIGIYFSSGDSGDETGGSGDPAQATPDWPAVSPWATAVGGTSLAVGAANNYLFETGWETGKSSLASNNTWNPPVYQYGSGGGTSRLFTQPAYQAGVVPNSIATAGGLRSQPMRVIPDVSMLGDPNTGMLIGQTQTFSDGTYYDEFRIGGTSLSSPLMAGVMALAQQRAGSPIGFANPVLYRVYSQANSALHDIVQPATPQGVVRVDYANGENANDGLLISLRRLSYDQVLTIHSRPGYDDVTGIGTPTGVAFLDAVAALR